MFIKEIKAAGMNGQSFARALTECTAICGPNRSGKTTTKNAVRLAVLGYVPEVGKTNPDTATMGLPLTVRATFDTGAHLERRFTLKKGSVSEAADTTLDPEDIEGMACPSMDPAEYFDKTPGERTKYIFERMKMPDTYSVEGILTGLHDGRVDEGAALDPAEVEDAKLYVTEFVRTALEKHGIAAGLGELTKTKGTLPEKLATWKKVASEKFGYVKTASELKLRSSECSADTIADLDAAILRVNRELELANQAAGQLAQVKMQANKRQDRRRELGEALAKMTTDYAPLIETAQKERDEALSKIVEDAESVEHVQALLATAREQASGLTAARESAQAAFDTAAKALEVLSAQDHCPHCGSDGSGWKEKLQATCQEAFSKASDALNGAQLRFEDAKQVVARLEERFAAACANAGQIDRVAMKERQIEDYGRKSKQRADLEKAIAALDEPTGTEELQETSNQVLTLRNQQTALSHRRTKVVELAHEISRSAEAAAEHAKALAYQAVIKHALAALKVKQAGTIEVLFKGLLETANYFTRDIMPPLVFQDGEIGYMAGETFVYRTLSGVELGIAFVAIAAALSSQAPFRLATIDEVMIDAPNRALLMRRMREAVSAGIIDQAIMISTEPVESAGWSVINLGPEAQARGRGIRPGVTEEAEQRIAAFHNHGGTAPDITEQP